MGSTAERTTRKRVRRERLMFRVDRGCLKPADGFCQKRLREKNFKVGDIVSAEVKKPREYWYHKHAHVFGELVAQNIPDFEGMGAHEALKRIQREGEIACEYLTYRDKDGNRLTLIYPRSLSYDEMDQAEFEQVFTAMCRHVAMQYWPGLTADQVADMAEMMGDQVA